MMSTRGSSTRVGNIGSSNVPEDREPREEKTPGRKSDTKDVPIKNIRFTQPNIDTTFKNGKLLKETLQEILDNIEHMVHEKIPPIKIYMTHSGYYAAATGNRRLFLFKLLCKYKLLKSVPVIILTAKPKSKQTHMSKEICCVQETILTEIVKRHMAASSEIPGKSDENRAELSTTPDPQGRKPQTPAQKTLRKTLGTLNKNLPHESSKFLKSVEGTQRNKPPTKEDGKEASTPASRQGLRKRKSELTDEKQCQSRAEASEELNVKETFRSPNKSFEDENDDSPKRRRMTPSPDQRSPIELKSGTTGNSQDMDDLNID